MGVTELGLLSCYAGFSMLPKPIEETPVMAIAGDTSVAEAGPVKK